MAMQHGVMKPAGLATNEALGASIHAALERLKTPATALQLSKSVAPHMVATLAELRSALSVLVARGRVHAWGKRFTLHDPQRIILEALQSGPHTQAELARALNLRAPGLATTAELRRVLRRLCRSGAVREHPKLGKAAQRYGLEPPPLEPFVKAATRTLNGVTRRLERAGVGMTDLLLCLIRELGEEQRIRERLAGAARQRDESRVHIKTDPGVPLAIRTHGTRRRKQTLPDSPGALRGVVPTDESAVLSALGGAAPGYSMTLAQLKSASGLNDVRFARAVVALTSSGALAVADALGQQPPPQALEDEAELETVRATLPPAPGRNP
jgi:hypothetical protein